MPNEWHNSNQRIQGLPLMGFGVLRKKSSSFFNMQDTPKEMDMTMSKLPLDRQQIVEI
jgi:hypothetical protein